MFTRVAGGKKGEVPLQAGRDALHHLVTSFTYLYLAVSQAPYTTKRQGAKD